MAGGASFGFLKAGWGIELLDAPKTEIAENAESLSQRHIEEYILDSDIRKFGVVSSLPKDLGRIPKGELPSGRHLVQVTKVADVTQPVRFQEDFEGGKWRLLSIDLSDGEQKFKGIEYGSVKDLGVHLPPGTKLLIMSGDRAPLYIQNGHLLLTQATVKVLGGNVEKLVASWKASKEVEERRLLWRAEGIKKKADGEGAPPWIDFDPRKARGGNAAALKKMVEDERAEWRKVIPPSTGSTAPARHDAEERDGPRFHVQDFKPVEGDLNKSQVASHSFAPAANGKGKGKGEGKGKGKGGKERRGRGDDWDGGEEKRAPVAVSTLAAFIKPTKKGELPEEAIALLAEPAAPPRGAAGAAAGRDEGGWEGGGWNDPGWAESGGAWRASYYGQGRGAGGKGGRHGGGGKGGSKGHRKGGGGNGQSGWY